MSATYPLLSQDVLVIQREVEEVHPHLSRAATSGPGLGVGRLLMTKRFLRITGVKEWFSLGRCLDAEGLFMGAFLPLTTTQS